jgi:hypothetical protein
MDSSVSIVTRSRAGRSGVRMPTGANNPRSALGPTHHTLQRVPWVKWPASDVAHSHLVSLVRIGGAVPPLTLYAFVSCIGMNLPSFYFSLNGCQLFLLNEYACLLYLWSWKCRCVRLWVKYFVSPGRFLERILKCVIFASFQILTIHYHPSSVFTV